METKRKIFTDVYDAFLVIVGCFIMGLSYDMFNMTMNIPMGGLSGLCINFNILMNNWLGIDVGFIVYFLIINAILLIFGYRMLGTKFAILSIVGIAFYSLFMEVCAFSSTIIDSSDLLLRTIFGSVLLGFGSGLTIRYGGSTGGNDIISCMINYKNSKISIGSVRTIINALVIATTLFTDGLELALYGLIYIYLCGITVDYVLSGSKNVCAYYIVSRKSKALGDAIREKMHKSVTAMHSTALTTEEEVDVLLCVINTMEANSLKSIIQEVDDSAFVFVTTVTEAMNKGFSKLRVGSEMLNKMVNGDFRKSTLEHKQAQEVEAKNVEIKTEATTTEENKKED